jgi:predicted DNA-binding transcriptional regulator YafY
MSPAPFRKTRARAESLRRILALKARLDGRRYAPRLVDLAREFECHERTIRRDLELLEELGVTVPKWRLNEQLADLREQS